MWHQYGKFAGSWDQSCLFLFTNISDRNQGIVLDLKQTDHVIHSTVLFPKLKSFSLVPDFTGGLLLLRRGGFEKHLVPGFDVLMLSPQLTCLTLGKMRLCSFSLAQLLNYRGNLKGWSKREGGKKSATFVLFADHKTFRVSLGVVSTDSEGGFKVSANGSKQIHIS